MLGMVQGKGGQGDTQAQGQGMQANTGPGGGGAPDMSGLAALFANNSPASGGASGMPIGMPGTPGLPQITQPERPTIAPPMARPIPPAPSILPQQGQYRALFTPQQSSLSGMRARMAGRRF